MATPKKGIDIHDRNDVQKSLNEWTKRLRAEKHRLSVLRRAIHRLKGKRARAKRLIARRKKQLKALDGGAKHVINAALDCRGQKENPYGSNRGPGIVSKCQIAIIGYAGVAWCGCFVGYFLKVIGGLPVTAGIAYTPNILEFARRGECGFAGVVDKYHGRYGDVATFDWNRDGTADHTGFILENLGNGVYRTLEGNTSFDNAGSQSNGGCVAERTRYAADILGIARPNYK